MKVEITQVDILLEKRKKLRRISQFETDTDYQKQILDIDKEKVNINPGKLQNIFGINSKKLQIQTTRQAPRQCRNVS